MQRISTFYKPVHLQPSLGCDKNLDPYELQQLKYQLAHIKCKCNTCATSNRVSKQNRAECALKTATTTLPTDQTKNSVDKRVQVHPQHASTETQSTHSGALKLYDDNILCPTCLIAFSFLRNGLNKIFKDQEVETDKNMTRIDKSLSRIACNVQKSTSMTSRLLSVSPDVSQCSGVSSGTWYQSNNSSRVRFSLAGDPKYHLRNFRVHNVDCPHIENLIDSIRPRVTLH